MAQSRFTKHWRTVRAEREVNEARVAAHERLMDAQARIAHARTRRGTADATIDSALESSTAHASELDDDELYLAGLQRYVAALGGRLELQAVFPEETIRVWPEPDAPPDRDR